MTYRGTTNTNARGGSSDRRRRREWLVEHWPADLDAYDAHAVIRERRAAAEIFDEVPPLWLGCVLGEGEAACRCYRCGILLTVDTVTVDRIVPGCQGGTYRRDNIRPACSTARTSGALVMTVDGITATQVGIAIAVLIVVFGVPHVLTSPQIGMYELGREDDDA